MASEQSRRTALGYRTFRCRVCRRLCNERTGTPYNQRLRQLRRRCPLLPGLRGATPVRPRPGAPVSLVERRRRFRDRWAAAMAELTAA